MSANTTKSNINLLAIKIPPELEQKINKLFENYIKKMIETKNEDCDKNISSLFEGDVFKFKRTDLIRKILDIGCEEINKTLK